MFGDRCPDWHYIDLRFCPRRITLTIGQRKTRRALSQTGVPNLVDLLGLVVTGLSRSFLQPRPHDEKHREPAVGGPVVVDLGVVELGRS